MADEASLARNVEGTFGLIRQVGPLGGPPAP
jgi:hypothetical protein